MDPIKLPNDFKGIVKAKLHKNLKQYTEINEYYVQILNSNQIIIYSRFIPNCQLYHGRKSIPNCIKFDILFRFLLY